MLESLLQFEGLERCYKTLERNVNLEDCYFYKDALYSFVAFRTVYSADHGI